MAGQGSHKSSVLMGANPNSRNRLSRIQLVMKCRLIDIQSTTSSIGPAIEKVISSGNSLRNGRTKPTISSSAITSGTQYLKGIAGHESPKSFGERSFGQGGIGWGSIRGGRGRL